MQTKYLVLRSPYIVVDDTYPKQSFSNRGFLISIPGSWDYGIGVTYIVVLQAINLKLDRNTDLVDLPGTSFNLKLEI